MFLWCCLVPNLCNMYLTFCVVSKFVNVINGEKKHFLMLNQSINRLHCLKLERVLRKSNICIYIVVLHICEHTTKQYCFHKIFGLLSIYIRQRLSHHNEWEGVRVLKFISICYRLWTGSFRSINEWKALQRDNATTEKVLYHLPFQYM